MPGRGRSPVIIYLLFCALNKKWLRGAMAGAVVNTERARGVPGEIIFVKYQMFCQLSVCVHGCSTTRAYAAAAAADVAARVDALLAQLWCAQQ